MRYAVILVLALVYPLPQEKPINTGCVDGSAEGSCSQEKFFKFKDNWPTDMKVYALYAMGDMASALEAKDGSVMVKLETSEYANLQNLRQAVVDEENRLAVKYGAAQEICIYGDGSLHDAVFGGARHCAVSSHYKFYGQFLLIEKAK